MPDFPTNPYKGQIFYDPDSDTIYEYFVPREDDYLCKKLKIKPTWVTPSYESELVTGLFSKNGKVRYFSYNKLIDEFGYTKDQITELMDELKGKDLIYERENAIWFRTTSLGKEQDRVYIKSTGEPTYRVPDTAYHRDKIKRKYDLIIDVFGADHADAYPDVICALEALGHDTSHIKVLIYQFVTLLRDGEKVKMSTRKADFVSLDDLIDQVGIDVVRYFFIMRSMNSHLDFDLDLASDQSDKNPVYYLQYAHARICNIISRANNLDLPINGQFDPSTLIHDDELYLLKHMVRFPENINIAYENLEPQISNIFDINKRMLEKVQEEKSKSLGAIKKKIKFYKSYKQF